MVWFKTFTNQFLLICLALASLLFFYVGEFTDLSFYSLLWVTSVNTISVLLCKYVGKRENNFKPLI